MEDQEGQLREIFEKSPIGILFYDKKGKLTNANPSALEIAGIPSLDTCIGLNLFDNPNVASRKEELLENGLINFHGFLDFDNIKELGLYAPTKSGIAFIDYTISNTDSGFLVHIQDITERKKAEESVVFKTQLLAQTGEAIISSDTNYNINYWNKAAEKTFGWRKEEVLGKNSGELLKTKIPDSSRAQEVSKMWKEGHWEGEAQYLRKDGKYFIANVNAKVLKDANGKDIGIVTVVRDITKHKKAEEELKENEEKFSKVFYANPGAIVILKPEGPILEVNNEFIKLTGYNRDEIIGHSSVDLNLVSAKFRKKIYEKMQEKGPCHNLELEIQTKSGEKRVVLNTIENIEIKGQKRIISIFYDITKRKKSEESLKKSEQRFSSLISASSEVIYQMSADWSEMLQLNSQSFLSNTEKPNPNWLQEYIPPDDQPYVISAINEAIQNKKVFELEHHVWQADGSIGWTFSRAVPILDNNGKIIEWFGFANDITERKKAEESLRKESEFNAGVLETARAVIIIQDKEGKIIRFNSYAQEISGYSFEEVKNKKVWDFLLIPEEIEPVKKAWDKLKVDGTLHYFENYWKGKDGNLINLAWSSTVIPDSEGNPEYVIGIAMDITERKKADEEIMQFKNRLEAALESIGGAIWELDLATGNQIWSPATYELYGMDPSKPVPLNVGMETIYPDDKESVEQSLSNAYENHEEFWYKEFRIINPKRGIVWIDGTGKIIYDKSGNPIQMIGVNIDITNRKKLEEELRESHDNLELKVEERTVELDILIEELERSNKELEQFAYVSSHDLQEPLRTIASFTQLLQRRYEGKFDSDADEFMEYIVEAAKRMKEQIEGLLEYSRVTTKEKEFKIVDVNKKLDNVLFNLKTSIKESKAEIKVDDLPSVMGDARQLERVFQNLISNAIKFRKCEEPIKIHISAYEDKENKEYVFSIKDNGIGIEKQYLERIFIIFQRLHTRDVYQGTGIGLTVVKKIVERHGGRIWVESEFGKGSTFYFTIPVEPVKNGEGQFLKSTKLD